MLSLQAPGHCSSGKNLTEHWLSRFSLLITVLLSLEVSASLAGTVPLLVQSAPGASSTGHSSGTVSLSTPSAAGDTIVLFVRFGGASIVSVTLSC